jgi:hypothetical protein
MRREDRVFEITRVKVWIALVIAALALTAVFELGVFIGKKRAIRAQRKAEQQYYEGTRTDGNPQTEAKPPDRSLIDQPTEQLGSGTKYAVQVSSFRSRENAEEYAVLLKSYGYRSWIRPESHAEETLYSVLVGIFDNKDAAEQFGRAISERLSHITGYMIREVNSEEAEMATGDKATGNDS